MDRAKEFLRLAELALENELYNGCAVCCYAAMFWAAITALSHHGFKREEWSHGGVKDTFTAEMIQKRHVYPRQFGTYLRDAYELRRDAHYHPSGAGVKKARRLLEHTHEFMTEVEEVMIG